MNTFLAAALCHSSQGQRPEHRLNVEPPYSVSYVVLNMPDCDFNLYNTSVNPPLKPFADRMQCAHPSPFIVYVLQDARTGCASQSRAQRNCCRAVLAHCAGA